MSDLMGKRLLLFFIAFFLPMAVFSTPAQAEDGPLQVATETHVADDGTVRVHLTLKNASRNPLFNIIPMFHFHHTMSMMPKIIRLEPGQGITLENADHPPVMRTGRYPLVVMVKYQDAPRAKEFFSRIHTDSFYFREPVESVIEGEIRSSTQSGGALMNVFLKNTSPSLKNVRMMLLLPPGLVAESFQGVMGFTLRGGEEKSFEIAVRKLSGSRAGTYPVHLMVEYAEMLKHYSGEVRADIVFGQEWNATTLALHLTLILLFAIALIYLYRKRKETL
ncbi:MAG: hypothetical protein V3U37_04030 [Nitrospinaceae bacterium]